MARCFYLTYCVNGVLCIRHIVSLILYAYEIVSLFNQGGAGVFR